MEKTITIDKKAFMDIARLAEELEDRIESLELASDPEFMASLKRSEEQIKKREFADWDELQNSSD